MIKVTAVQPESIAEELGLRPGSELVSINGRELEDFLDWEFLTAEEELLLFVRQPDGEEIEFDIARPLGEPLGVSLEPVRIRRCANRCDFCFVDGLPDGLRDVLYIRDDDYRLSFRFGNFATLTNLKPRDIERIIEYRLSPLYVSVHATDPTVRRYLLRNPVAPEILPQLRHFADHGIEFHTQVVMSPGVNDGPVLQQTLEDLYRLGPAILTCSVVPVGLTEFSKHHLVREPTVEECRTAVRLVEQQAVIARAERQTTWAFGADELYLRANLPLPLAEIYGDFDQVENGVGSVRWLQQRIVEASDAIGRWDGTRIGVVTGTAMGRLMPMVLQPLARLSSAHYELIPVVNSLFGPSVTTAGLLPGAAVQQALTQRNDLDLVLVPGESLNDDELFIDSMPLEALAAALSMEVRASKDFADALRDPALR
jgi:putative radical SAM enzyme (TIGR03279 family)